MNTEQARDLLAEWARQGQEAAPPAWEELPGIPLYMDQVILYLGESLELFQREGSSLLTSSMINNYVKTGLIPHPEKKKYTKEHLAGLMAVCMLKQVLPIQDIKTLFSGGMDPHTYALFRQAHTEALAETCRSLEETCASGADLKQAALLLAAEANAKRAAAQRILSLLGEDVPKKPKEKGEGKGGNPCKPAWAPPACSPWSPSALWTCCCSWATAGLRCSPTAWRSSPPPTCGT